MKTVVGIAFGVVAICGLSFAVSSNAPDRPPGIAADRWAPISSTMGVVLAPDSELAGLPRLAVSAPQDRTELYAEPTPAVRAIIEEGQPVRGYIMVKRGKVWRPLTVVAPSVGN
jgi:hypothetical protein